MQEIQWAQLMLGESVFVAATEQGLCRLSMGTEVDEELAWLQRMYPEAALQETSDGWLSPYVAAVEKYLDGQSRELDLPLDLQGTAFQKEVWRVLQTIPYGEVWSYGDVAFAVGRPKAARAVGGACGKNPVMLVVPCHRVVGQDGSLTGFGGGLRLKARLLEIEKRASAAKDDLSADDEDGGSTSE